MRLIGYLDFIDESNEFDIFSNDFINFYDETGAPLDEEKIKDWVLWINSPRSYDHFHYIVKFQEEDEEYKWHWHYIVFGSNYTQAGIVGFGNTPQEAITNCQNNFKELQEKYNPDHISM